MWLTVLILLVVSTLNMRLYNQQKKLLLSMISNSISKRHMHSFPLLTVDDGYWQYLYFGVGLSRKPPLGCCSHHHQCRRFVATELFHA